MRNKLHARVIPALAAALGGLAMLGMSALPASAAPTATAATARTSARMVPQVWYYYSNYPTLSACRYAGIEKETSGAALTFKCIEVTAGDYFVWDLYLYS